MKALIGVHGKKGAGKDTVAAMISYYMPMGKVAFADRLKKTCAAAFDVPIKHFYEDSLKEEIIPKWGLTPRTMMMSTGDAIQTKFPAIFLANTIPDDWKAGSKGLVVTDVRREEEANMVRAKGGLIIHVLRPVNNIYSEASNGHWTEAGIPVHKNDQVVNNAGDKLDLMNAVRDALMNTYGEEAFENFEFERNVLPDFLK